MNENRRIKREKKTIKAMISIYCSHHHGMTDKLCLACDELRQYSWKRLDKCLYGPDKPQCSSCPVHCYKPAMQQRVKTVMSYAGPKMVFRHPVLAMLHLVYGFKKDETVKAVSQ
ncbi:MAG: nitrous oxide-stimulated promoter family protein [Fibrobacteria bacterium]|nr:nitrous oxide-stimulated promoter family protein [Fibrobacteria bacterium]